MERRRRTQRRLECIFIVDQILFGLLLFFSSSIIVQCYEITGNLTVWDSIFTTRSPTILLNATDNLKWTEGPVVWHGKLKNSDDTPHEYLLFSETIDAKIYSYNIMNTKGDNALKVLLELSGDAPLEDYAWRAEPGSNGLALIPKSSSAYERHHDIIIICQHGAQRLALLNIKTGERIPLVTEWGGRKLNGPNDLVVRREAEKIVVYFTDPVYAWLEQDRMQDLPYLDDRVKNDGPGFCGVYRVEFPLDLLELSKAVDKERVREELSKVLKVSLVAKMDRPNGIGLDGDNLVVAECCQGSHNPSCTQGTSRWIIFQRKNSNDDSIVKDGNEWKRISIIEDVLEESNGGCADSFEVLDYPLDNRRLLIASCSGGLCIVDLREEKVVARLMTSKKDSCKIANVADGGDRVFITGNCGVWELELQKIKHLYPTRSGEL